MNTTTPVREGASVGRLMAIAAMTATLAACGGGGDSAMTSAPAPSPAPAPAPAPAPIPSPGDLSSPVQPTSYAVNSAEANPYAALNAARLQGGFGTLVQSLALDQEAQSQADFVTDNDMESSGDGGLMYNSAALVALQPDGNETAHVQLTTEPSQAHFTGYLPSDRATHFGYPSTDVAESATYANLTVEPGTACVKSLLTSPAHCQLLLDPRLREVGLGIDAVPYDAAGDIAATTCYVATAARSFSYSANDQGTARTGWVGIFPADGSMTASLNDGHGHGFAPSLTVDSHLTLTVTSFTITTANGAIVSTTLDGDASTASSFANWAFATPTAALQPNTTYTVSFQGSANGVAIAKVWSFTTATD